MLDVPVSKSTLSHHLKVLSEAGFVAIERSTHMGSAHEALRVDEFSAVASAQYGERHYSLFVEARKAG